MAKTKSKTVKEIIDWRFGINLDSISRWINIVSFLVGILFYFRLERNMKKPTAMVDHKIYDSLLVNDAKLSNEIFHLRQSQENIISAIEQQKQRLSTSQHKVKVARNKIDVTVHNEWKNISPKEREEYVKQTMSNLKNKKQHEKVH
jgi:hypothetical protein